MALKRNIQRSTGFDYFSRLKVELHQKLLAPPEYKKYYDCYYCHFSFNNRQKFVAHIKKHFICFYCNATFINKKSLSNHFSSHVVQKIFSSCKYCLVIYKIKNHIIETATGEKLHVCNICNQGFSLIKKFNAHLKTHPEECNLCENCKKDFPNGINNSTKKLAVYDCQTCNIKLIGKSSANNHTKKHKNVKFHCNICGKLFVYLRKLEYHWKLHYRNPQDINETTIENISETTINLTQALKKTHYDCPDCNIKFASKYGFYKHTKDHKKYKHPCRDCNNRFIRRMDLDNHWLSIHARSLQPQNNFATTHYDCSRCNIKFATRDHLTLHIEEHERHKHLW